jgi:hypothetical protein
MLEKRMPNALAFDTLRAYPVGKSADTYFTTRMGVVSQVYQCEEGDVPVGRHRAGAASEELVGCNGTYAVDFK